MTGVAIIDESSPRVRPAWRGGRVVYGSGLENQRVLTGTVGSNPTLSVFIKQNRISRGSLAARGVREWFVADCD